MNIFVGNLAVTVTEQDLRQLFESYGTVDTIEVVTDGETSRPYGFGFVDMPERSTARAAIARLHGTDLAGCALTVNEANLWAWHGERSYAGGGVHSVECSLAMTALPPVEYQ